jgi:hypothetical protein
VLKHLSETFRPLHCGAPASEQLENQSDQSEHEQQMNESAERVAADYSDEPEHKQDYEKGPKHRAHLPRSLPIALVGKKAGGRLGL